MSLNVLGEVKYYNSQKAVIKVPECPRYSILADAIPSMLCDDSATGVGLHQKSVYDFPKGLLSPFLTMREK